MEILKLENVSFSYGKNQVLNNMNCSFEKGRMYVVTGRSGSGKTTLLSLMSGLAAPDEGRIICQGNDISKIDQYEYRSSYVGVIFQNFNLLTKLTAAENVELSMDIAGKEKLSKEQKRNAAYSLLEKMGLTRDEADRRVLKLSGGQQQRVAIARALSYDPEIVLADEPTGNLDEKTQLEIVNILKALAENGKCVIVVTHSSQVAKLADEVIEL